MPATIPQSQRHASVLMIGGARGMGEWLVRNLFLAVAHADVCVIDIEAPDSPPSGFRFERIAYSDDAVEGLPDLADFGVIVVAVPRAEVRRVAERILPHVAPGALVLDVVSVKEEPLATIASALPDGIGLIGTHPLFGYALPSLIGQTVIVCPTPLTRPDDLTWLRELLSLGGATVVEMEPCEHDRAMAIVQVLTHFTAWTVAATLQHYNGDFARALLLQTPPFRALAGLVGRVVSIPDAPPNGPGARLFADIQTADYPDAGQLRTRFARAASDLASLTGTGDGPTVAREAEAVATHFPPEVLDTCKQFFAQSHATAQSDAIALHERRMSGNLCAFRSTTKGRVLAGRVIEFSHSSISLQVCSASTTVDGRTVYGFAPDDETHAALAELGFTIPNGRIERLARGDYRLLSDAELEHWRAQDLLPYRRDLTLLIPAGMDADRVIAGLTRLYPGVLASELIDRYDPPAGSPPRWTARLSLRGDRPPKRTLAGLIESLSPFGIGPA